MLQNDIKHMASFSLCIFCFQNAQQNVQSNDLIIMNCELKKLHHSYKLNCSVHHC